MPDQIRESVCRDLETIEHTDGNHYCLLHLPSEKKDSKKFDEIIEVRKKEVEEKIAEHGKLHEDKQAKAIKGISYNFRYVFFPEDVNFSSYKFLTRANFSYAAFSGEANFLQAAFSGDADFSYAAFSGAVYFGAAAFSGDACFSKAAFSGDAYFRSAAFSGDADFSSATFSGDADFRDVRFNRIAQFSGSKFKEKAIFRESWLNGLRMANAVFEKPKLAEFNALTLSPGSFVGVDFNEFNFTAINWENNSPKRKSIDAEIEIGGLDGDPHKYRVLAKTCRKLAKMAEDEKLYQDASNFYSMAAECHRLEKWYRRFLPFTLHWWYWASSLYGESWRRAAALLLLLLGISTFLYTQTNFEVCQSQDKAACETRPLNFWDLSDPFNLENPNNSAEALRHSLGTALFQKSDTRKPYGRSELIVYLEMIFVPLQAALLALAIRRKFMR